MLVMVPIRPWRGTIAEIQAAVQLKLASCGNTEAEEEIPPHLDQACPQLSAHETVAAQKKNSPTELGATCRLMRLSHRRTAFLPWLQGSHEREAHHNVQLSIFSQR